MSSLILLGGVISEEAISCVFAELGCKMTSEFHCYSIRLQAMLSVANGSYLTDKPPASSIAK